MTLSRKALILAIFSSALISNPLSSLAQQDHSGHGGQAQNSGQMQHDGDGNSTMQRERSGGGMMNRGGSGDDGGMMNHGDDGGSGGGGGMMNRGDGNGGGGGMMRRGMRRMQTMMNGGEGPATVGQSAFAVIRDVVNTLQNDPNTDWSLINLEALRQHLIDMDRVTLYADASSSEIAGGARYIVTGDDDRTIAAIQRMVPTHALQIEREMAWDTATAIREDGVELTIVADDAAQTRMIRGLGFIGFMVQGEHHADHHLMMAGGSPEADSGSMGGMMMDHGGNDSGDMMNMMDHGDDDGSGDMMNMMDHGDDDGSGDMMNMMNHGEDDGSGDMMNMMDHGDDDGSGDMMNMMDHGEDDDSGNMMNMMDHGDGGH